MLPPAFTCWATNKPSQKRLCSGGTAKCFLTKHRRASLSSASWRPGPTSHNGSQFLCRADLRFPLRPTSWPAWSGFRSSVHATHQGPQERQSHRLRLPGKPSSNHLWASGQGNAFSANNEVDRSNCLTERGKWARKMTGEVKIERVRESVRTANARARASRLTCRSNGR